MTAPGGAMRRAARCRDRWVPAACVIAAMLLRAWHLDRMPIWQDEGLSLYRAGGDLATILSGRIPLGDLVTTDVHPPLYFLLLGGWFRLVGSTTWLAKVPPLLASLPSVTGVSASFAAPSPDRRGRIRRTMTAGGPPIVVDTLDLGERGGRPVHLRLQHHAQAFFQGNRYLLATLASRVVSLVPEGPVIDLYAGVGLFSASLAASGWTGVAAVEGDPAGAADLKANAAPFGGALQPIEMAVESYLATRPVDPPATRSGPRPPACRAPPGP